MVGYGFELGSYVLCYGCCWLVGGVDCVFLFFVVGVSCFVCYVECIDM